jgi:hypothetical protein
MIHRIDAKDPVERVINERQSRIRVRDGKAYPIGVVQFGRPLSGRINSCFICVDSRNSATQAIRKVACGPTGTASDFKNVMLGQKIKPRKETIIFLNRIPTILANVLAEYFFADRFQNLPGEVAVGAVEQINALRHLLGLSINTM